MNNNEIVMRESNPKMVPIPREYSPDFWFHDPEDCIELTCLMPNGIVILLKVSYNATLSDIKEVCIKGFVRDKMYKNILVYRICGMRPQSILYMGSYTICPCMSSHASIAWLKKKNCMMSRDVFAI